MSRPFLRTIATRVRLRRGLAAATAAILLGLAGCASIGRPPAPEAPPGFIPELTFPAESDAAVQGLANYNFLAAAPTTRTWIYEPLMIRDTFSCRMRPWLATAYEFTDPLHLVLTIRQGVTWSDGEPFTPQDVVFNFLLGKKYPAADRAGLWTDALGGKATGVEADGDRVIITFAAPAPNKLDDIVSKQQMVPEHLWKSVGDPTKYVDEVGIGTGPFTIKDYNGQRLELSRNPGYWQADTIKVQQLNLQGNYQDPNAAALKMRNGDLDVFTGDIPNPVRSVRRSGQTDFYYSAAGTTVIAPNNAKPGPTSDAKFREALAYGTDKEQATLKATYGVMKPASQTMLNLPVQSNALPAKYKDTGGFIPYDPSLAAAKLDAAGYAMGSDGFRTGKDGKPMSLVFSVQAGYIDYLAIVDTVTRNWRALGINIKTVATDPNAVDTLKKNADFDFALEYVPAGCVRSRDFGDRLSTSQITPKGGESLLVNVARYSDPATDKVIKELQATTDPAEIKAGNDKLIDVWMTDFPLIAVNYAPSRLDYRNADVTGWPTEQQPYPVDSLLYVMTQLRPK